MNARNSAVDALIREGRFELADAKIAELLAEEPENPELYFLRAGLRQNQRDYRAADADLTQGHLLSLGEAGERALQAIEALRAEDYPLARSLIREAMIGAKERADRYDAQILAAIKNGDISAMKLAKRSQAAPNMVYAMRRDIEIEAALIERTGSRTPTVTPKLIADLRAGLEQAFKKLGPEIVAFPALAEPPSNVHFVAGEKADAAGARGVVYWYDQEDDRFAENGLLSVFYRGSESLDATEVARALVDALESEGLAALWFEDTADPVLILPAPPLRS